MAHNRLGLTRVCRVHGRRAPSFVAALAVVALIVCLAAGSAVGCSSTTTAKTGSTTESGRGPELSTKATGDLATASLQQEYQNLLDESRAIRSALEDSGSKGDGNRLPALRWPIAEEHVITSAFGPRFHPVLERRIDHEGFDLAAATSTPILAAAAGRVLYVGNMEGHGKTIIVDHGNGLATVYCHLSHILVDNGERVTSGETIAKSGSTGLATGPHLHFEVRVNGTPEDPKSYVR